jgi:hypothetical protein
VKRSTSGAALACGALFYLLAAAPVLAQSTPAPSSHDATVEQRSKEVMPFDLDRTMHVFEPTADGGVQSVLVHDGDPQQIALVRSHLRKEADAFARGDFADPAAIHGTNMPGLAQLRAGASRIAVTYIDVPNGGSLRYKTSDPRLIAALHEWFAAQVKDHGAHAMMAH